MSEDRAYRYMLTRSTGLAVDDVINFVGLNPSTADELADDPTVRRCLGFARAWAYGRMTLTNLYGLRATDPRALAGAVDPTGPDNYRALVVAAFAAQTVVPCWGSWGGRAEHRDRAEAVLATLNAATAHPLHCFGLTAGGQPRHPLYLPRLAMLVRLDLVLAARRDLLQDLKPTANCPR